MFNIVDIICTGEGVNIYYIVIFYSVVGPSFINYK